jgi:hypothetical protein
VVSVRSETNGSETGVDRLEATTISNPGEPIKAALRMGAVIVIALRLGPGIWEPLYAIYGKRRTALPRSFNWTLEAIGALEAAVFGTVA